MTTDDRQRHVPLTPLAFHILISLGDAPRHGYGIILDIEERTGGEMRVRSGTLYTAIQRLQADALVTKSADPPEPGNDERRRYYEITQRGRQVARLEAARLETMLSAARQKNLADAPETVS